METTPEIASTKPTSALFATPGEGARPKRWTREEFHRLADQGWFDGKLVELINGEIIELSPHRPEHAWAILRMTDLLREAFAKGYVVRTQLPIAPDDYTEPDPDVSVVAGSMDDYIHAHPPGCALAVEVSNTTQAYDKQTKAGVYARAGVAEYWVLDLQRLELVVFREPVEKSESPLGYGYRSVTTIPSQGVVSPLERPTVNLKVAEMLPPV